MYKALCATKTAGSRFEAEAKTYKDDEREVGFASLSALEVGRGHSEWSSAWTVDVSQRIWTYLSRQLGNPKPKNYEKESTCQVAKCQSHVALISSHMRSKQLSEKYTLRMSTAKWSPLVTCLCSPPNRRAGQVPTLPWLTATPEDETAMFISQGVASHPPFTDIVLLIESFESVFKRFIYPWCIQCHDNSTRWHNKLWTKMLWTGNGETGRIGCMSWYPLWAHFLLAFLFKTYSATRYEIGCTKESTAFEGTFRTIK